MISRLREILDHVVVCLDTGDSAAAMVEIARFTLLFEEFMHSIEGCVFKQELENLNRCMVRMVGCMEQGDLQGLKEVIVTSLSCFLDDWDFHNGDKVVN